MKNKTKYYEIPKGGFNILLGYVDKLAVRKKICGETYSVNIKKK